LLLPRRRSADAARAPLRAFLRTRRATAARLRRVQAELVRWDEYDAAAAMPADLRPEVERPTLSRGALTELRRMLAGVIDQFEEAWERRN
jgi:hypothetical protein